jgi:heme exporter protein B
MIISLLLFNLKLYIKNYSEAIYIYVFYSSVLALFAFAGEVSAASEFSNLIKGLWVAGLLSVLFVSHFALNAEEKDGALDYVPLWPVAAEWVILAKYTAILLLIIMPLGVISCCVMMLMGVSADLALKITPILTIAMASMAAITLFVSILTVHSGNRGMIGAILALPLIMPIVIAGSIASMATDPLAHSGYTIVLAHAAFMIPMMILVGAALIRAR